MIDKSLLNKYSVYHIEETSNEKFIIKQQVEFYTERGLDFFPFSNCIKISGSYLNISNNNFKNFESFPELDVCSIYAHQNKIETLQGLNVSDSLSMINLNKNNLTNLKNCPHVITLNVESNSLVDLNNLPISVKNLNLNSNHSELDLDSINKNITQFDSLHISHIQNLIHKNKKIEIKERLVAYNTNVNFNNFIFHKKATIFVHVDQFYTNSSLFDLFLKNNELFQGFSHEDREKLKIECKKHSILKGL